MFMKPTFILLAVFSLCASFQHAPAPSPGGETELPVYHAPRARHPLVMDARWDKPAWRKVRPARVEHFIRDVPAFHPRVEVKMMYDDANVYVIFNVHDRYVRCLTDELNGPVWHDAAVEFFFAPDSSRPRNYFNLEVNCGGTALLGYRTTSKNKPTVEDIRQITVAHTLPSIVDPEIKDPVTWTIEYSIPLAMLAKYSHLTRPAPGVVWRGNFCKIAENNTNPHHMTWAPITDPKPTFHMPQYFGKIVFQ